MMYNDIHVKFSREKYKGRSWQMNLKNEIIELKKKTKTRSNWIQPVESLVLGQVLISDFWENIIQFLFQITFTFSGAESKF